MIKHPIQKLVTAMAVGSLLAAVLAFSILIDMPKTPVGKQQTISQTAETQQQRWARTETPSQTLFLQAAAMFFRGVEAQPVNSTDQSGAYTVKNAVVEEPPVNLVYFIDPDKDPCVVHIVDVANIEMRRRLGTYNKATGGGNADEGNTHRLPQAPQPASVRRVGGRHAMANRRLAQRCNMRIRRRPQSNVLQPEVRQRLPVEPRSVRERGTSI